MALDGKSIGEQVVAGAILLTAGAVGALGWEHRRRVKRAVKRLFSPESRAFRKAK